MSISSALAENLESVNEHIVDTFGVDVEYFQKSTGLRGKFTGIVNNKYLESDFGEAKSLDYSVCLCIRSKYYSIFDVKDYSDFKIYINGAQYRINRLVKHIEADFGVAYLSILYNGAN